MEINVTRGQNIIQILCDGFLNTLIIKKPLAANWDDCAGSVAQYYAVSRLKADERAKYTQDLNHCLTNGNNDEIIANIKKFINLFSNGKYYIYIEKPDNDYEVHYINYKRIRGFLHHFYPFTFDNYLFTQPKNHIDQDRVNYYIELIEKGMRPKPIIYSHFYSIIDVDENGDKWDESFDSGQYVLDGHHKLLAYMKLNIIPEVIHIEKQEGKTNFVKSLENDMKNFLNNSEYRHYVINKDQY